MYFYQKSLKKWKANWTTINIFHPEVVPFEIKEYIKLMNKTAEGKLYDDVFTKLTTILAAREILRNEAKKQRNR